MRLVEHQAKAVLRKYGICTPMGEPAFTPEEAEAIASRIGRPVAVKAQVLVGGRGKAGGIAVAETSQAARTAAERILGMYIKGITVSQVLVEEAVAAEREYYAAITIDRAARTIIVMVSTEGGVDIEEVAEKSPEKIARMHVGASSELFAYQARSLAVKAGFDPRTIAQAGNYISNLYTLFMREDASLAEINPLMVIEGGRLIAADAKIILDDNALARHPECKAIAGGSGGEALEIEAAARGLTYVKLDGNIGVIGNGAGLVMATLDALTAKGGRGANFLDIGGGARAEVVRNSLELLAMDSRIKAILINVFGGITRCDEVACGLLEVLGSASIEVPIVVRLAGTRCDEGRALLCGASVIVESGLDNAAARAVALAGEGI